MPQVLNSFIEYVSFDSSLLMQPDMIIRIVLQILLLCGSAFFSGSETALFSLSDVDLEQLRKKRHPKADLVHELLSQPRHLIVSILSGNELINIAATANLTGILLILYGADRAGWITIFIMVPLILLFGEITPKTVAVSHPLDVSTRIVSTPMSVWVKAITPLRWLIRIIADRVTTMLVGEARDAGHILRMSEFRSLVAEIEEEGLLSATDRVLIYNLLDAGRTEIEHIMIPRTQIHFARTGDSLAIVTGRVYRKRLRIPVYDESVDNIAGFVHAEDITKLLLEGKDPEAITCRDILHPPLFLPLTKSVDETLDFFQEKNDRAAVVLNEFGGVSGLVTIEEILNFIFAEIAGNFIDTYTYTKEAENAFIVSGSMKLTDFEALTNFGIEDPRMTTIGGVAFRHLGLVPDEGETVTVDGIQITVLEMDGNRIAKLKAEKKEGLEENKGNDPAPGKEGRASSGHGEENG
ncbi:MAG: hemolysin family protein [Syntrophales bacterium]|jgi:CBS domain containing-hemolysin-like protein|nr:hemolysin family protein [Syntrophales bacterium]MDY0044137.1 hemolysin family protein [Syntrophales bacterium]